MYRHPAPGPQAHHPTGPAVAWGLATAARSSPPRVARCRGRGRLTQPPDHTLSTTSPRARPPPPARAAVGKPRASHGGPSRPQLASVKKDKWTTQATHYMQTYTFGVASSRGPAVVESAKHKLQGCTARRGLTAARATGGGDLVLRAAGGPHVLHLLTLLERARVRAQLARGEHNGRDNGGREAGRRIEAPTSCSPQHPDSPTTLNSADESQIRCAVMRLAHFTW